MWNLPGPGIEPASPTSAGGFLATGTPGRSQLRYTLCGSKQWWQAQFLCSPWHTARLHFLVFLAAGWGHWLSSGQWPLGQKWYITLPGLSSEVPPVEPSIFYFFLPADAEDLKDSKFLKVGWTPRWKRSGTLNDCVKWSPPVKSLTMTWTCDKLWRFYFIFWVHCVACRILVPWTGNESAPPTVEAQSLNHWTHQGSPATEILDYLLQQHSLPSHYLWPT